MLWQCSSPRRSSELDERGQLALSRGVELAGVLPQLRRHELVAEEPVELLLGGERLHLAGLGDRDAVLRDRETAADRLLAERDVVLLRAGEVLQQVAEALRRHDAQVEPEPLLRHDRRLRVAVRDDLEHARQGREERRQRGRVGRRGDHVEVSEALAPAAHAAGLRHLDRRRMRAKRLDHVAYDREPDAEQASPRGVVSDPLLERLQDLLLAPLAQALEACAAAPPPRLDAARPGWSRRARARSGRPSWARARATAERRPPRRDLGAPLREARASRRPRPPRRSSPRSSCRSPGARSPSRRPPAGRRRRRSRGCGWPPCGRRGCESRPRPGSPRDRRAAPAGPQARRLAAAGRSSAPS